MRKTMENLRRAFIITVATTLTMIAGFDICKEYEKEKVTINIPVSSEQTTEDEDLTVRAGVVAIIDNHLSEIAPSYVSVDIDTVKAASEMVETIITDEDGVWKYHEVPVEKNIFVYANRLNLRVSPSTEDGVITILDFGTELETLSEITIYHNDNFYDQWTKVRYGDTVGYVNGEYISDEKPYESLGNFEITYYCPCELCCGWANMPTASGVMPTEGVTIAADPMFAFDTELIIDGHTYVVEDRGGAIKGNKIDIFVQSHEYALSLGRHEVEVLIKKSM